MKLQLKIYLLLIALFYFSTPLNSVLGVESHNAHSGKSAIHNQVNEKSSSLESQHSNAHNYLIKSSENTFSSRISENNTITLNPTDNQNSRRNNFGSGSILLKKKFAKFYITATYISQYKYIYSILKNSITLYPFHFFK